MTEAIQLAKELSGLSTLTLVILVLIAGGFGVWGFTWQHKQQLALKDELAAELRKAAAEAQASRDEWKAHALESAKTTAQYADHVEQLAGIVETVVERAKSP